LYALQQTCDNLKTPHNLLKEYADLKKRAPTLVNKKRKDAERELQKIKDAYKTVEQDNVYFERWLLKQREKEALEGEMERAEMYLSSGVDNVLRILTKNGFIGSGDDSDTCMTLKGQIASQLHETHCLVFSELIEEKQFGSLSSEEIVVLLSCFTNVRIQEDRKTISPNNRWPLLEKVTNMYSFYQEEELQNGTNTGTDYSYHYDLLEYMVEWTRCENVEDCKFLLQKMGEEKELFLGEFVKAVLKISNMASELEKVAEMVGDITLLKKLRDIPRLVLKFVVTNQSLYI
jgi:antiviral helicase SKI2